MAAKNWGKTLCEWLTFVKADPLLSRVHSLHINCYTIPINLHTPLTLLAQIRSCTHLGSSELTTLQPKSAVSKLLSMKL